MTTAERKSLWKTAQRVLPVVLSLAIAAGMVFYILRTNLLAEIDLSHPNWGYVALLVLSRIVVFALMGLLIALFMARRGTRLDLLEWLALSISSLFLNTITPVGGAAVVRGGYLKLKHHFPLTHFTSFIAANIIINYLSAGVIGMVTLLLLSLYTPLSWPGMLLTGGVALGAGLVTVLPVDAINVSWLPGRLGRWLTSAMQGWREFRTDPLLLAELIVVAAGTQFVQAFSYQFGLLAVGERVSFLTALFLNVTTTLARVTPVRDIFGINEFAGGLGAQLVGLDTSLGVTAALMQRLANVAVLFVLGPLATYVLSKRLGMPLLASIRQATEKKDE